MKKQILTTLVIGFMAVTSAHAQTVVIQRPGILTDLASAAGAIVALPLAAVEGIVVGTVEASGSLIRGSTEIVVVPPTKVIPAPVIVAPPPIVVAPGSPVSIVVPRTPMAIPTTTITTTYGDGSATTVTRQASAYELGPVIVAPVDPNHRVGPNPHVNPYVCRPR